MTRPRFPLRLINLYPPFVGAGIRARRDGDAFEVRLRLTFWNRNYVGTQFGGSLYSMCDPFFMLLLIDRLGGDYVVWDKAATIHFRRPGRSPVRARFEIPAERVEEIRQEVDRLGKSEPRFEANVVDEKGQIVAQVEKLLHVRRKEQAPADG